VVAIPSHAPQRERPAVQAGRGRDPAHGTPRPADRRGHQHALVLVAQRADGAVAREFAGVEELVHVGEAARVDGVLEEVDDGALEGDDLRLELGLRDCWSRSVTFLVRRG
jgi:hypothetical protein